MRISFSLRNSVIALALCFATAFVPASARADSWSMPKTRTVLSANRQYRLTIAPRKLSDQLSYFEDKVAGHAKAGQAASGPASATAKLERRVAKKWAKVWTAPLVNDVSPVDAIVADDGSRIATFDDWHFMGGGENVVVVYGPDGRLQRRFGLTDIMPDPMASAARRSVSSIWWRGEPSFARDNSIVIPLHIDRATENKLLADPYVVEVQVEPVTGVVTPRNHGRWTEALMIARRTSAALASMEVERKRFFAEPIAAPTDGEESSWHAYLRETFYRIDPEWKEGFTATTVLRAPTAKTI